MNRQSFALGVLAFASLALSEAQAGVDIVVDFSSAYGTSSTAPGSYVNNLNAASGSDAFTSYNSGVLYDYATGTAITGTSLSVTTTGGDFYSDWTVSPDPWSGTTGGWLSSELVNDYIGSPLLSDGASLTLTISGLSAGSYSLSLVSSASPAVGVSGAYYENISVTGSGSAAQTTSGWDPLDSGEGLNSYLTWSNITVDATGTITIAIADVADETGALIALNGFRLTAVPEPAETAVFFGTLALMGAWFHRRKKTTVA